MKQLLPWIIITICLFGGALSFLIIGIVKRKLALIFTFIAFLVLAIASGARVLYLAGSKIYKKMEPEIGMSKYREFFYSPDTDCVTVLHANSRTDLNQRCSWLEFTTCPQELNRIIEQYPYEGSIYLSTNAKALVPASALKPKWYQPQLLGDSVIAIRHYTSLDKTHKTLIFSKDSSHAYYCEMTEKFWKYWK